ncbi:MAG: sugar phosphate nucleotidyltransferase, partial [Eubacteriales bacterium]
MSVAGIIFSNIHDSNISDLTRLRTMASVPFGCRYRLIDFTLSNMVNSGITNVYVITHYNYHSLMDHIGSGKDWDLARARGGITILPPFISAFANNVNVLYKTRLEALKSINHAISNIKDDYVVLSDCDVICNIDLNEIISDHIKSGADMTIAVKRMYLTPDSARINVIYKTDEGGVIQDVESYPANFEGEAD